MKSEVWNGDCMEYMARFPDKFFELAVVDPPYGIGANKMTLGNGKKKIYRGSDDWDKLPPMQNILANYGGFQKIKSFGVQIISLVRFQ